MNWCVQRKEGLSRTKPRTPRKQRLTTLHAHPTSSTDTTHTAYTRIETDLVKSRGSKLSLFCVGAEKPRVYRVGIKMQFGFVRVVEIDSIFV